MPTQGHCDLLPLLQAGAAPMVLCAVLPAGSAYLHTGAAAGVDLSEATLKPSRSPTPDGHPSTAQSGPRTSNAYQQLPKAY